MKKRWIYNKYIKGKKNFLYKFLYTIVGWILEQIWEDIISENKILYDQCKTETQKLNTNEINDIKNEINEISKNVLLLFTQHNQYEIESNKVNDMIRKHHNEINECKKELLKIEQNLITKWDSVEKIINKTDNVTYFIENMQSKQILLEKNIIEGENNFKDYSDKIAKVILDLNALQNTVHYCTDKLQEHSFINTQFEQFKNIAQKNIAKNTIEQTKIISSINDNKLNYQLDIISIQNNLPFKNNDIAIIQVVPVLKQGDAIGNLTLVIDDILRDAGIPSYIYTYEAENIDRTNIKFLENMPFIKPNDILILHMAAENYFVNLFSHYKAHKVLYYHNITPDYFFTEYDYLAEKSTKNAIYQLKTLYNKCDICIADSEYNKKQLLELKFSCEINVIPIPINFNQLNNIDYNISNKYEGKVKNIIFVGRIAPNKNIEDILLSYKEYKECYNKKSRLIIVGKYNKKDKYYSKLLDIIIRNNIEDVEFVGYIKQEALNAIYKTSNLFLCLSKHEGFCVPLVEAMYFNIPIIAYDAGAVKETLGTGGEIIQSLDIKYIGNKINEILNDKIKIKKMKNRQNVEMNRFSYINTSYKIKKCLLGDN